MHLLLSNDDGIDADGLQILRSALREAVPDWRITVVAPDREQSATSHALTLSNPLRVEPRGHDQFSVTGTPTDCILVAMNGLLKGDPPEVVLSGINHGPNMGEDVHYSGTVAAAFEGMIMGLPSMALSLASKHPRNFEAAIHFVSRLLPGWIESMRGTRQLLNVNIPSCAPDDVRGVRVCRLGSRSYDDTIVIKEDPRGRAYYWIGGDSCTYAEGEGTDFVLSAAGYLTVTPLKLDITDHAGLERLSQLSDSWTT